MNASVAGASPLRSMMAALADGTLSPTQAIENSLARIEVLEPLVRAWVEVDAAAARSQAREQELAGRTGTLWGVPFGVKDLFDVAGMPTRCGTALRGGERAAFDAAAVGLLRAAGGVVLGKTVTTEFGYFKPGPTRNPRDPGHTPGGSSSGSAAAVAAGMVPVALGTQTAGSLTRPASYCGVAGFVTPTGRIPTAGITGLSPSLDTVGILAAATGDLRIVWSALAGVAAEDAGSPATPRLAVWDGSGLGEISKDMDTALTAAAATLTRDGARCVPLADGGAVRDLAYRHGIVMAHEAALERAAEREQLNLLSQPLQDLLTDGARITPADREAALAAIDSAGRRLWESIEDCDAILGPAALSAAPEGLEATGSPVLSRPWQALGLPVITIPGLRDSNGLPLGLQLIGRKGREQQLFDIAEWIESRIS